MSLFALSSRVPSPGGCRGWKCRQRALRPKLIQRQPNYAVSVATPSLVLCAAELPSSSHRRLLAPFLLHPARPAPETYRPNKGAQTPHEACAAPPLQPPLRLFSTPRGDSRHIVLQVPPARAERMVRRLLVPGRATGSNVMPEVESVTVLRIRLTMTSCGSVNRMREFGSTADPDIFAVTSRRERIRLDGAEKLTR